jgi:hypothetical protein
MEYIILKEKSRSDLEEAVNESLKLGYVPLGGVCHVQYWAGYDNNHVWSQAIIKE